MATIRCFGAYVHVIQSREKFSVWPTVVLHDVAAIPLAASRRSVTGAYRHDAGSGRRLVQAALPAGRAIPPDSRGCVASDGAAEQRLVLATVAGALQLKRSAIAA